MKNYPYMARVQITLPSNAVVEGNTVTLEVPERAPTMEAVTDAACDLQDPIERAMMLASIETVVEAMDARAVALLLKMRRI